ncbi:MAG: hypothetical protein OXF11_02115 [Deltaproteobacteria bacterium]|nr:hypothetical protein [Deltaproteobacteria bacterium]
MGDGTRFTGSEDVQEFLKSDAFAQGFKEWLVSSPFFKEVVRSLADTIEHEIPRPQKSRETAPPVMSRVLMEVQNWNLSSDVLARAGWLPHYTMPFGAIAKSHEEGDKISSTILDYYDENWETVRGRIERRLVGYEIDAEARATFREALDAHESRLHRCVCRVLFPEIERVLFTKLFGGLLGNKQITYDEYIRTLTGENRHIEDFIIDGLFDLSVFGHLTKAVREKDRRRLGKEHVSGADAMIFGIFSNVKDEARRQSLARNAIPNRHAALHGLVSYSSSQHSLNTIFLADYMFGVVSRISK